MKILKEGKVPENKRPVAKCISCGCEFEYEKGDIKNFYLGGFLMYRYVDCPQNGCLEKVSADIRTAHHEDS